MRILRCHSSTPREVRGLEPPKHPPWGHWCLAPCFRSGSKGLGGKQEAIRTQKLSEHPALPAASPLTAVVQAPAALEEHQLRGAITWEPGAAQQR